MNNLCADIGYKSINHYGEQLCGDHVEIIEQDDDSTVVVLADGLGSGVKASILSTLTSKIISTMMAAGLSLEECVNTIAATLPVCSVRGVAYSTFSIIHIKNNEYAEIIQYDNPQVILLRNNKNYEYARMEMNIGGKKLFRSLIRLEENDIFVAMSDGCPHAGIGLAFNFGWKIQEITEFLEVMSLSGLTAKNLSTLLVEECDKLYGHKPGDDTTACVIRIRKREPMNILFGPPSNRDDNDDYSEEMFNLMKVLCEISVSEEWYRTFTPNFWQCDDDIEIDLSICEPKKIYKEMTGPQYVALVDLGMWRMDKVSDIEEWILIRDKYFDNQSWIFFIKKGLRPIHKRVLRELIKRYTKLKVK